MFTAYVILAVLVSVMLIASATGKLTGHPRVVDSLAELGVPRAWHPWLAAAECAGALGLLVGIAIAPLAIAAAIGLILYFAGAVTAHLRAHDTQGLAAPLVLLALAAVVLWLRLSSL